MGKIFTTASIAVINAQLSPRLQALDGIQGGYANARGFGVVQNMSQTTTSTVSRPSCSSAAMRL
jgi:hypothetical protein